MSSRLFISLTIHEIVVWNNKVPKLVIRVYFGSRFLAPRFGPFGSARRLWAGRKAIGVIVVVFIVHLHTLFVRLYVVHSPFGGRALLYMKMRSD